MDGQVALLADLNSTAPLLTPVQEWQLPTVMDPLRHSEIIVRMH